MYYIIDVEDKKRFKKYHFESIGYILIMFDKLIINITDQDMGYSLFHTTKGLLRDKDGN